MKKDKKKKVKKAEELKPTVLIGNTLKKSDNPLLMLAVKLIFTYLFTFGIIMNFTQIYGIPYELGTAAEQTLLFVTVFFAVFTLIRLRYVIPATVVIAGGVFFLWHSGIISALSVLKDHLLIYLDSRLLSSIQYVPSDSVAYLTNTQDYISGKNLAMLIVTGFIAYVVTLCCYKKFSAVVMLALISALYVPAIIAEKADYTVYLPVIILAYIGMFVLSSSNEMTSDYKYRSKDDKDENTRLGVIDRAYENILHYRHSCLTGLLSSVAALLLAFSISLQFPGYSYLDVNEVIDTAVKIVNDAGEYFSNLINGDVNSVFSGYFSTDNFFINNHIEINSPPSTKTEQILRVYSNTSKPIYLIGDIGVNFNGSSWESIQQLTGKNTYIAGDTEISDSFSNDNILPLHVVTMRMSYDDSKFLTYQDAMTFGIYTTENLYSNEELSRILLDSRYVRIDYLKNTNIVFKPYMLTNGNYLNRTDSFSFYGDSVLRVNDSKDWMQRYESDFIVPESGIAMTQASYYEPTAGALTAAMSSLGYSNEEINQYLSDKSKYDDYVRQMYMNVPDSEKENAARLNQEFADATGHGLSDYAYAYMLSEYLKNNYSYSLNVDNSADSENTVIGHFLFDTKRGHCALYASAMVLALREHGIPARYITGFSVPAGTYSEQSGVYESVVLENNLHAWAEAYFPNLGWLAFDPTGSGSGDTIDPEPPETTEPPVTSTTQTTTEQTEATTPQSTEETTTAPETSEGETTPPTTDESEATSAPAAYSGNAGGGIDPMIILIILIILAGAGLIIGTVMFFRHVNVKEKRRFEQYSEKGSSAAIKDMYGFIMKLFSVTDLAPNGSELPMDYAARIDELMSVTGMNNNLAQIMEIIEKVEFSDRAATEEERQRVLKYTRMLYSLVMDSAGRIKRFWLKLTL